MVAVDAVLPRADYRLLATVVFALAAGHILRSILSFVADYHITVMGQQAQAAVREDLFRHVLRLPMTFFDVRQTGYVTARLSEVSTVGVLFGPMALVPLVGVLEIVASMAMMLTLSWKLAALVVVMLPFLWGLATLQAKGIGLTTSATLEQAATVSTRIQESLSGIQLIKECQAERHEAACVSTGLRSLARNFLAQSVANALACEALDVTIALTGALVLWCGVDAVLSGTLTVGGYLAFSLYMARLLGPSRSFAGVLFQWERAAVAVGRLSELRQMPTEQDDRERVIPVPRIVGGIAFRDVHLAYETRPDVWVLRGVSFEIVPGETVALVGPSGSGKTSIVRLILGLYRPTGGVVLVDGHDVCHVRLSDLRDRIGVVSQQTFLFDDTVFNNIRYSRPNASRADVIRAARTAIADEFIERLPLGYETVVGERGTTLSGGQLQRIAIARTLLRSPDIVIYDEPTSQLDPETEQKVLEAAYRVTAGRTTIVISHRPEPLLRAGRQIVLHHGIVTDVSR
jgi:subfamily B ATP-binding cassette protein MsbA